MKKKILALFMSLFVALSLSACSAGEIVDFATNNVTDGGSSTQNGTNSETAKKAADTNPAGMKTIAKDKLKIGVLYIGSASAVACNSFFVFDSNAFFMTVLFIIITAMQTASIGNSATNNILYLSFQFSNILIIRNPLFPFQF